MPAHFGFVPLASLKRRRESSETLGLLILHDWDKTLCWTRIRIALLNATHIALTRCNKTQIYRMCIKNH